MVLDLLAERSGAKFKAHRGRVDLIEGRLDEHRVLLAKPKCYMNESGGPVASVRDFFKVPPDHIVVVYDELDLPFGTLRLKLGGGDNGHNGVKSVRASLGTGEFHRVRIGIGRPTSSRVDPAAWVLQDFSAAERKEMPFHIDRAADAVEVLITEGLAAAQNRFNALPTD
jgi:PTH1 family peptidyl-tRNA hydrolase